MSKQRTRLGRLGEQLAVDALTAAGMSIIARNVRTRYGEIDVIALDRDTLVFAEVKALRAGGGRGPAHPLEAVGPRKQLQVRRLARAWLAEGSAPRCREIRFDAIGVTIRAGREPVVEHVPGAF